MSSEDIILKLWKIQHQLPSKLAIAVEKQTVLWLVTVFLSALITKHLLIQLLIHITMVLVKILSKNDTITINVLLVTNLVKRTLICLSMYGIWKRKIWIIFSIGTLLWNHRNMFADNESVIYIFVSVSLLQITKVWFMYLWVCLYWKSRS